MLGDLFLAIVGVKWVFPMLDRETLLAWRNSFMGKRREKAWMLVPFKFFGPSRGKETIVFYNEDIFVNRTKSYFLCNFWSWTNFYIIDRARYLVDFLTWLRYR